MNRFRTKKKAKEEAAATSTGRASSDEQHSFMGFRRKQKPVEEEKQEIDITNVLPPSDDFRTSLLMTGLSARFSMLREQDDPNTKIGKALDDSVLYPNRQSKLMDFGFRGLDDIAEVESIRPRPPFMRTNSFASDSDSIQDSIMNRTRPTDGNNLFGGRQKIYRIPAGGVSSKNIAEGGMGGRALYEHDVALSAFQKLRQEKKEAQLDYDDESQDANMSFKNDQSLLSADNYEHSASYQRSESPSPIDYNLRRETSSTASSGARNSTAATSVTSQPGTAAKDSQSPQLQSSSSQASFGAGSTAPSGNSADRMPISRIRRLYEQGLNQDLHEQQSSALSRIDTLTGKRMLRAGTPEQSGASSPTTSLGFADRVGSIGGTVSSTLERLERRQALTKTSAPNLRSMSPPMSGSSVSSGALPTSESASLNVLVGGASVSKNAFPTSPPLSPPVSDSGGEHSILAIQPNDVGKATALGVFQKPTLPYDESRYVQRQLQLQQGRETPTEGTRPDSDILQTAAPTSPLPPTPRAPSAVGNEDAAKAQTTFLFDDEEDDDAGTSLNALQPSTSRTQVLRQRPSDADHPAFRQPAVAEPFSPSRATTEASSVPDTAIPERVVPVSEKSAGKGAGGPPVDSPTLGPGGGLSGMVLQHLRSSSNASSIYSMVDHHSSNFDAPLSASRIDTGNAIGGLDMKIDLPWEDQNWAASVYDSTGVSEKKDFMSEQSSFNTPLASSTKTTTQRPPIPDASRNMSTDAEATRAPSLRSVSSRSRITSVADSNRSSNNPDGETEDDDFANQLANARKRVQERLTTYVESDSSRNTSPLLLPTDMASQPPPIKPNSLGLLRAKSSRGSLLERSRDVSQPKSLKKLGLGASTMSTSPSPSKLSFEDAGLSPLATPPLAGIPNVNDGFSLEALKEEREEKQRRSQDDGNFERVPASVAASTVPPRSSTETDTDTADEETAGGAKGASGEDDSMHPGLRAFRNARRRLQKRKELDSVARHQADEPVEYVPNSSGSSRPDVPAEAELADQQSLTSRERRPTPASGAASRDRKPPPPAAYYQQQQQQQRDPGRESRGSSPGNLGTRSRSGSRTSGQAERERSGSEASNGGGYSRHVPPRIKTTQGGLGYDEYQHQQSGTSVKNHLGPPARQGKPMRSPGLPGTDIRRSPHMPPQPYPGSSPSMNSLSVQTPLGGRSPSGYNTSSTQPSPISPLGSAGLPMSPYYPGSANTSGPSTPTANGLRMQPHSSSGAGGYGGAPSSLNEAMMMKNMRKNDASDPAVFASTSRVPAGGLPQSTSAPEVGPNSDMNGFRSRSGSRARAGSNAATAGFIPPLPPINPLRKQSGSHPTRGLMGDNEGNREQRPLRKQASEASGMHSRMMGGGAPGQRMDYPGGMI
ncbi:MAG: hypothetical protein STHCBS139747_007240 [Sporothrix thermara]